MVLVKSSVPLTNPEVKTMIKMLLYATLSINLFVISCVPVYVLEQEKEEVEEPEKVVIIIESPPRCPRPPGGPRPILRPPSPKPDDDNQKKETIKPHKEIHKKRPIKPIRPKQRIPKKTIAPIPKTKKQRKIK
jgi:hypothetical protein